MWLHDSSPAKTTNVLSSDYVRVTSAATRRTAEGGLIGAIGFVDMSARRACSTGVSGINQHNGDTNTLCFVGDKRAELEERPAMQLSTLLPLSPHPRANTLEVFKADRSLRAFGSLNQAFADRVVHVFGKAALLAGKLFQSPSRRFCSQPLEFCPQSPMAIAHVVDRSAAVDGTIRVAGDVGHAEINSQHIVNVLRIRFLYLARYQQIPVAAMKQQITLALPRFQHPPLTFTTDERNRLPPVECPDRERRVEQGEREDAVIVGDTGVRAKHPLGLFVQLVGIAHFGEHAHRHLCRQAERLTHMLIAQLLQRKLPKRMCFPRDIADGVARSVGRFKRALERIRLFGRRLQLQVRDQLHILNYSTKERLMQPERRIAFLCAPEGGGFLPPFL